MARIGVVTFYQPGGGLAHHVLGARYYIGIDGPIIGVINASGVGDPFPESPKGRTITATHFPGDTTP